MPVSVCTVWSESCTVQFKMADLASLEQSKIFVQNRALGYVSGQIPLVTRYIKRRKETFIVTCVGKVFHTYGSSHLTLLSVSGPHPGDITCLAADNFHVYTASNNVIFAWRRGTELKHVYKSHEKSVHSMLPFGPNLLSIDEENTLKVWNIKDTSLIFELNFSKNLFQITALIHPNTYINKVLFGSQQGQLQLWNINNMKLIYTFNQWNKPITVLKQAPAIDIVAIGFSTGRIILHNLKYDKTIFDLTQDWGGVTSISFSTDGSPIMATGNMDGHIVLWNLEERKVESQLHVAHNGAVKGLSFIENESLLISSSPDNSLKSWIIDRSSEKIRLLRRREGHMGPPTIIRFYGNNSSSILSASVDSSLKVFSTISAALNQNMGRAYFKGKSTRKKEKAAYDSLMPPIMYIAAETTREKEWSNIAALHLGLSMVTTWSYDQMKMGKLKLLPQHLKHNKNAVATALCITKCGSFIIIGYNTGHIDRFNMQSGIHRASYGNENGAHRGIVSGLTTDCVNQTIISAGQDGLIKFWNFKLINGRTSPQSTINLKESIKWLRYHNESFLIAAALENFDVIIIDQDTKKIVRLFQGHNGRLTDACFNTDSRWLITASMDCTIRTWDIPSGHLIDVLQVSDACTSLDFSPSGEFLITAHVDHLGLYLWSNRTVYSHVSLKAIDVNYSPTKTDFPETTFRFTDGTNENINELNNIEYEVREKLDKDLLTMSNLASSKWRNIIDIDIIKKKVNVLNVPEKRPFFLSAASRALKFDIENNKSNNNNKILSNDSNSLKITIFSKLLEATISTNQFSEVIKRLKLMGPSLINFEIKSLSSISLMLQFLELILHLIKHKYDFELAHSYLTIFLKWHASDIINSKDLRSIIMKIQKIHLKTFLLLRGDMFYSLSIVQSLK
ncbi:WD repeat-containing protein 36-like [Prorops nasuta]|uniref:WD repeat-containing protein 36-like n=1 Tax=Prorops nasuta TaxID=863751 RepID=UPI0034CDC2C3